MKLEWLPTIFLAIVVLTIGWVFARFPAKSLAFLDSRHIAISLVPRTVVSVRLTGVVFLILSAAALTMGVLALFGVVGMTVPIDSRP